MDTWKGRNASGPRAYTEEQYDAVVVVLKSHVGPGGAIAWRHLLAAMPAAMFGENDGRTIREIVSRADGVEFVVDDGAGGVYVCESLEQTEAKTNNLRARQRSLQERIMRRQQFAARELPRLQGRFPG